VALAGLRAGCHVMLEKPMAVGVGACEEIERAAEQAGRLVGVSHNQLFYGPHVRLAELLDSGALGRLRALRARLGIGGKYGAWRADPAIAGGGLLIDAGVHRVYMMRRLGGRVRALQAAMDSPRAEDAFVVTLEFESGAIGVIDAAYHGPQGVFDDRIEVFCDDGLAEVAGCEAFFEGYLSEGPKLRVFTDGRWRDDPVDGSWDASVSASVHSMVRSLARGERPVVDAVDGKETVAIVEAAYRAAETGERVELASVLGIGDPVP
jgi:UDP-N-acetylglucosamine 3-dehydrogenase